MSATSWRRARRVVLWLLLAGVCAGPAAASTAPDGFQTCAQTHSFRDGDTFTCVTSGSPGQRIVVRVAGLDAPESGQPYSRLSRERLRELAGPGAQVGCYKMDVHGRGVCRVRTPQGQDAVEQLLRDGLAWHDQRYLHEQTPEEQQRYARAQEEARSQRRGLWRQAQPQPPWACHSLRQRNQDCR